MKGIKRGKVRIISQKKKKPRRRKSKFKTGKPQRKTLYVVKNVVNNKGKLHRGSAK